MGCFVDGSEHVPRGYARTANRSNGKEGAGLGVAIQGSMLWVTNKKAVPPRSRRTCSCPAVWQQPLGPPSEGGLLNRMEPTFGEGLIRNKKRNIFSEPHVVEHVSSHQQPKGTKVFNKGPPRRPGLQGSRGMGSKLRTLAIISFWKRPPHVRADEMVVSYRRHPNSGRPRVIF